MTHVKRKIKITWTYIFFGKENGSYFERNLKYSNAGEVNRRAKG